MTVDSVDDMELATKLDDYFALQDEESGLDSEAGKNVDGDTHEDLSYDSELV